MRTSTSTFVSVLACAATTNAWAWVAHNAIISLPASAPAGLTVNYQPLLRVENGCVPFPAVDALDSGRAGAGLAPGGALNGDCGSSTGQVYSRSGFFDGKFGIMYSYYMPKDQILAIYPYLGHRNDWEGLQLWFSSDAADATLLAVCVARHGNAQANVFCDKGSAIKLSGKRPKIVYKPDGTHALFTYDGTSGLGGGHPLIDWTRLPAVDRTILNEANYGDATPPFKDSVWDANMRASKAAAAI